MPQIKRKPVHLHPLPSLSSVLTPTGSTQTIYPATPSGSIHHSSSHPPPPGPYTPHAHLDGSGGGGTPAASASGGGKNKKPQSHAHPSHQSTPPPASIDVTDSQLPEDGKDDDEQLDRLQAALKGDFQSLYLGSGGGSQRSGSVKVDSKVKVRNGYGQDHEDNPTSAQGIVIPAFKVKDVDCFYIPETGEVFLDYESYAARYAFYQQSIFQCEATGKGSLTYYKAIQSEVKEARQLHTRFPRQLKKAVLTAVQFQIEGKLDNLADRVYERFVNRFFDDEKVFVDVQGDKYLARIVKTFVPRSLLPQSQSHHSSPVKPHTNGHASSEPPNPEIQYHPYATDLSLTTEEVTERDDPMKYFYNVRLIEEGNDRWDMGSSAAVLDVNGEGSNGDSIKGGTPTGNGEGGEDGRGERWGSSTMEVQADKISRDRINFSRAMLKRFIRDCVTRDPAVYSPWLLKPNIAHRYGIPTVMPEHVRLGHLAYKERQMDKRKREREERLGIAGATSAGAAPPGGGGANGDGGTEVEEEERRKKAKIEEEVVVVEVETKRRKPLKYPAEDLLVEFAPERDLPAGRVEVRPKPEKTLPFQDKFERFLMAWSFLNVMGKPLGLSPFTLDDFEQSLYHNDPYNPTSTLLTEIHAVLLNALMFDLGAQDETKLAQSTVISTDQPESGSEYWEGKKGSSVDTLRPLAEPLALTWYTKELVHRDSRKGWESTLVGCLWAKATLDALPSYLDNILHMLFEDKPAPTRPTWSTGPSSTTGVAGLIPSKPEKRYGSLHFTHKLDIICWLVDLVLQTGRIRDFLEESVAALTEVRKDQVEVKREWKRVRAERDALEPKEKAEGDADGDVSMGGVKVEQGTGTPEPFLNGGTKSNTEKDELDSVDGGRSSVPLNGNGHRHVDNESEIDGASRSSSPVSDIDEVPSGPSHQASQSAAERRKAMAAKAAERSQAESERLARAKIEREAARIRKAEHKNLSAEKRRLQEEEDALEHRLKQLDYEFRSHIYTLRSRPLGVDRFGNKVWWMDGLGSNSLADHATWGTGRLYIQGVDEVDLTWNRLAGIASATAAAAGNENIVVDISEEEVEARRNVEEGDGKLEPGQWAMYDTPDQLAAFVSWLNPKGTRELQLWKQLKMWYAELEGGIKNRRKAAGLDVPETTDEPRRRPTRKAAGGEDEKEGFLSWKNRRAL